MSASVELTGAALRASIRLAAGSFDRNTTVVQLFLDTDENAQTGLPGLDGAGADASLIGIDYFLSAEPSGLFLVACRTRVEAECTDAGPQTGTVVADGVDFVVSRARLGNDDGRLTFKVIATTLVSGAFIQPDLDVMPDVGAAAGRVQ